MTHREIGSLLDMSINQVTKVVTRFNGTKEPLASWMNELITHMASGGACPSIPLEDRKFHQRDSSSSSNSASRLSIES